MKGSKPVASTHGHKHGTWPAIDGETPDTERQFKQHQDMPRLQDVGLPKAVNQELASAAGDGALHVDKSHKE